MLRVNLKKLTNSWKWIESNNSMKRISRLKNLKRVMIYIEQLLKKESKLRKNKISIIMKQRKRNCRKWLMTINNLL